MNSSCPTHCSDGAANDSRQRKKWPGQGIFSVSMWATCGRRKSASYAGFSQKAAALHRLLGFFHGFLCDRSEGIQHESRPGGYRNGPAKGCGASAQTSGGSLSGVRRKMKSFASSPSSKPKSDCRIAPSVPLSISAANWALSNRFTSGQRQKYQGYAACTPGARRKKSAQCFHIRCGSILGRWPEVTAFGAKSHRTNVRDMRCSIKFVKSAKR